MSKQGIHLPASEPFELSWRGEVALLQPADWAASGVLAAVSTRIGGVSEGAYGTMNPSLSSGDDPARVEENRRRLVSAIGASGWPVATAHQVHGREVHVVATPPQLAWGQGISPRADALVTTLPGVLLTLVVADCVPILLRAPGGRGVAVVHAGWRGSAAGVTESAVRELCRLSGAGAHELEAAIGPAIGPECYPVGEEVRQEILRNHPWALAETAGGRLDLPTLQRKVLEREGLEPKSVLTSGLCTRCWPDLLFSYRRDGARSGRMAAIIGLEKQE